MSEGHQCQPSRSKPRAIVSPSVRAGAAASGAASAADRRDRRQCRRRQSSDRSVEERLERGVVERPVVGHAVEASGRGNRTDGSEGSARSSGSCCRRRRCTSAGCRRGRVVDRVVLWQPPHVRSALESVRRCSSQSARRVDSSRGSTQSPCSRHTTRDAGARERQAHRGARRPRADDEHVGAIVGRHRRSRRVSSGRRSRGRRRRAPGASPRGTAARAARGASAARPGRSRPSADSRWPT